MTTGGGAPIEVAPGDSTPRLRCEMLSVPRKRRWDGELSPSTELWETRSKHFRFDCPPAGLTRQPRNREAACARLAELTVLEKRAARLHANAAMWCAVPAACAELAGGIASICGNWRSAYVTCARSVAAVGFHKFVVDGFLEHGRAPGLATYSRLAIRNSTTSQDASERASCPPGFQTTPTHLTLSPQIWPATSRAVDLSRRERVAWRCLACFSLDRVLAALGS